MNKIASSKLTLPIVWIFFFLLTHWPKEDLPETPSIPHLDKVVHFLMYAILSYFFIYRVAGKGSYKKHAITVLVVLAIYAVVDELTQPYVGRTAEFLDWVADICGATAGIMIHRKFAKKVQVPNLHNL